MIEVLSGADRLEDADRYLKNKRIAMLTNASGIDKSGIPTYIRIADKYKLDLLLSPEHGIRGNLQDGRWGSEEYDSETGARIYCMGSKDLSGLDALLDNIDIAVYDIQDVGARFYTYLYNLTDIMIRCARKNKDVLILDRPNPVGGVITQGHILDEKKFSSSIGKYAIPTRYGLTAGEFAKFVNDRYKIGCNIEVIPCEGWKREMYYDDTDLLWVNPSPNIPSVGTAINYIGTCIFEATNISEARGTTRPFDMVGAPFVDSGKLMDELNSYPHDGVVYRRTLFTPGFNKYAGECCEGVEMHITDRNSYNPLLTALRIFNHMRNYKQFEYRREGLFLRWGDESILENTAEKQYSRKISEECDKFHVKMSKYMLY